MKTNWNTKKISEVVKDFHQGLNTAGQKIKFFDEGYPIIQTRNLDKGIIDLGDKIKFMSVDDWNLYKDKYKPSLGDVFLTNIGTIGKTAVVIKEEDYLIHWNIFIFKLDENELLSFYLKYFLDCPSSFNYYNSFQKGGTVSFITKKIIANMDIPIPSLSEQKQIVAILDEALTAIDQAKANIEKNIKNAKELFQSKLNDIFSQKGDGWEEKTLGEVCLQIKDGAHHSPKILYPEKGKDLFPYVTSKNIRNNYMDLTKLQYVDKEFHNTIYPVCSPNVGDILLTKDGANTGNITLNTLDEPFSLLSSVCLMKPKGDKLIPDFLKYYIQSPIGFKSITGKMTGTAIKRIVLRTIKAATLPIPNVETQKSLVSRMDELYQESKQVELLYMQKLDSIMELEKSILQKAFAGELTNKMVEV